MASDSLAVCTAPFESLVPAEGEVPQKLFSGFELSLLHRPDKVTHADEIASSLPSEGNQPLKKIAFSRAAEGNA